LDIYTNTPVIDRSGTATTTSTQLSPATPNRRGLEIQNVGANNIGINEFGGVASVGTKGTWTLAPGYGLEVRTNQQVNIASVGGSSDFTAVEW